jgi:hypothetical protein
MVDELVDHRHREAQPGMTPLEAVQSSRDTIPHCPVSSAQLNPALRSSHRSPDTSPPLLVDVASSSVADRWMIHHSDLQREFIRSWGTACAPQLVCAVDADAEHGA